MDREATDSGTVQHWVNHRRRRCRRRGYGTSVDSFDDIIADIFFISQNAVEEAPRPSDSKMSLLQKLLSE